MSAFLRAEFGLDADLESLLALDARGTSSRAELCAAIGAIVGLGGEEVWGRLRERFGTYAAPIAPDVFVEACRRFDVCVLTNGGSQNQRTKLATLGIDALIAEDRILISAEIGVAKPDVRAFQAALAAVGCAPSAAVYVGDHPAHDIVGARAAGMRTCWVARGRAFPDTSTPDWTIESIAELPQLWDRFPT